MAVVQSIGSKNRQSHAIIIIIITIITQDEDENEDEKAASHTILVAVVGVISFTLLFDFFNFFDAFFFRLFRGGLESPVFLSPSCQCGNKMSTVTSKEKESNDQCHFLNECPTNSGTDSHQHMRSNKKLLISLLLFLAPTLRG